MPKEPQPHRTVYIAFVSGVAVSDRYYTTAAAARRSAVEVIARGSRIIVKRYILAESATPGGR
jgi:hypothetical protein